MLPSTRVLRTKITPPPPGARTLARPRVNLALHEALQTRLTILQAGAGYGKSTALACLASEVSPVAWYSLGEEDHDPLVFLLHLCHTLQLALPGLPNLPTQILEAWDGSRGPLPGHALVDQILNSLSALPHQPLLLVIDDAQYALDAPATALLIDRLASLAPAQLHILLSGRPPLSLPGLPRWLARGEARVIDQATLAFDEAEIAALFTQRYGYELTGEEVHALQGSSEGWAIALQLIWQSLRSGSAASIQDALARQGSSLDSLFTILAGEVFGSQPADVQDFLRITATLRVMTAAACDALRSRCANAPVHDSAAMLAYLRRQDLFVVEHGPGALRYHHIFHVFLQQQAGQGERCAWHSTAANLFLERQDFAEAFFHLLQAEDLPAAAALLESYGAGLLAGGRLDALAAGLDALTPEILANHPPLLFFLGELARLRSRFSEALGWYQQAEALWRARGQREGIGRALRGQARVYLDTVNPARAEELLQQAIRISDGMDDRQSQARLYELLAENKLNAGRIAEAEALGRQAAELRDEGPSDSQLNLRVLLRTGRLEEARQLLETRAETERHAPVHTPRAHRETLLLLSLIQSFMGSGEQAYQSALEGTRRGLELGSPFVTAVGHMRQGHALMLPGSAPGDPGAPPIVASAAYTLARDQFNETLRISRSLSVNRLEVEAYWGLCRAHGYQGDLAQALPLAQQAIETASTVGDEWIASLVRLSTGASLHLAGRYELAETWLLAAIRSFEECSDAFGRSAARLWLCLGWFRQARLELVGQVLPQLLHECCAAGYDFLFTRPSLLGPPDERMLTPLLLYARSQGWESAYIARLLSASGISPEISLHPGCRLWVNTLGRFQVWRGAQPVLAGGWRREKSRQLFQILLTAPGQVFERDQLCELLWPELDPAAAQRSFKVTLNTLYQVLEPDRPPGQDSAYIERDGSTYRLRSQADLWLDASAFQELMRHAGGETGQAAAAALRQALALYQGEFLPDARYETWAAAERERLAVLFLHAADRLSEILLASGKHEEVIVIAGRILAQDNCWERAYRSLMLAYHALGDHGQAARAYQRCKLTLQAELNVAPSQETEGLYERLFG